MAHLSTGVIPLLAAVALGAGSALAQGAMKQREYPEHGFRLKAPQDFAEMPLEPNEQQVLVKLQAKLKTSHKELRGEHEVLLLLIRIVKQTQATTGTKDDQEEEEARARSMKEQSATWLNGGKTFVAFLQRRGWVNDVRMQSVEKPFKCASGAEFKIAEVTSRADHTLCAIRGYLLEDEREIVGLVAIGNAIDAFRDLFKNIGKTLERTAIDASAKKDKSGKPATDPYANSTLRGVEQRRKVRSRMPAGWVAHDTENFILITNSPDKKLVQDALVDLEVMRKVYVTHFPPIETVEAVSTVRLCDSFKDYMDYGAPAGSGGYWNHIDEELVVFDTRNSPPGMKAILDKKATTLTVLYHEGMHQYHFYSNGQAAPASWFNEGYGEYFGGAIVDRQKQVISRIDKNKLRMDWVKEMQKQKAWPDLRSMLKMSQGEFYGDRVMDNYAMGWALCYFLETERAKKDGRPEWQAIPENYLKHLRAAADARRKKLGKDVPKDWITMFKDEMQEEAFKATFASVDIDALEVAWKKAMAKY